MQASARARVGPQPRQVLGPLTPGALSLRPLDLRPTAVGNLLVPKSTTLDYGSGADRAARAVDGVTARLRVDRHENAANNIVHAALARAQRQMSRLAAGWPRSGGATSGHEHSARHHEPVAEVVVPILNPAPEGREFRIGDRVAPDAPLDRLEDAAVLAHALVDLLRLKQASRHFSILHVMG